MAIFTGLISLAILASAQVYAAPARRAELLEVAKYDGETSGRYIVTLKDGVEKTATLDSFSVHKRSGALNVTHEWEIINAFAGDFDDAALEDLRASPDVLSIEEDGVMSIFTTQTNAPWGIARLSADDSVGTNAALLTYSYTYDASAGAGVDVYIVDTGILTTHTAFGGRASWGATYGGYASADGHGHGTHCAGIAVSGPYGVAKAANVIAVKVLSDAGSGYTTDIVSGLNFVSTSATASGKPTVASLSLGGGASTALDNAVTALITAGIHVTVAAGNSATDAGSTSPARATAVTTVGATDITDAIAYYSNYGSVVDIFAPGSAVISSWSTSTTATNSISGTSMATPHVAGLIAYFIGLLGADTPAALQATLAEYAQSGVISGIPSGTKNLFAHNN